MTVETLSLERNPLAFPTLTETAVMIGVDKSTVSRAHITVVQAGANKRVLPEQLLGLALKKGKKPVTEVAAELINYTRVNAPDELANVEREVEEFFAVQRSRKSPLIPRDEFLAEARQFLTDEEFARMERRYDEALGRRPGDLVSSYEGEDA